MVYAVIIAAINITSNSLLIWALKKTGQTKTISFQFIITMSVSDLLLGTGNLVFQMLNALHNYKIDCWVKAIFHTHISICSLYSLIMVALIALDRYLHMRYLERYPLIVTKKRGYILNTLAFLYSFAETAAFALPLRYSEPYISQAIHFVLGIPIMLSVFILYFRAIRTLRTKASQLCRDIITQTRALSTAATRITVCLILLSLPLAVIQGLELANRSYRFTSFSLLSSAKLFAFATLMSNGFCNAFILMSVNRPIKMLLRRYRTRYRRNVVGST